MAFYVGLIIGGIILVVLFLIFAYFLFVAGLVELSRKNYVEAIFYFASTLAIIIICVGASQNFIDAFESIRQLNHLLMFF